MKKFPIGSIYIISIVSLFLVFESKAFNEDTLTVKKYAFPSEVKSSKNMKYNHLLFSPISNNKIWLLDANEDAYEFDIETANFKSLRPFLGGFSVSPHVVKDSNNDNIFWIHSFHEGVIKYDKSTGTKTVFTIREFFRGEAITKVVPRKDKVWICTAGGLFYFLRKDGNIVEIKEFKNIWINSVYPEKDRLWIKSDMIYFLKTKKAIQFFEESWPYQGMKLLKVVNGYKIFGKSGESKLKDSVLVVDDNDKILAVLKEVPLNAVTLDNDENLWFFGPGIVKFSTGEKQVVDKQKARIEGSKVYNCEKYVYFVMNYRNFSRFDKLTGQTEIFEPDRNCQDFIVDDNYFWVLFEDGIVKLNKTNNDSLFKLKSSIKRVRAGDLFEEDDIIEKIKKAGKMISSIQEEKRTKWVAEENNKYTFQLALRTYDAEDIKRIQYFLNKDIQPLEREIGYYILVTSSLMLGHPGLSLQYYDKFKTEFPKSDFLNLIEEEDIKIIKATDSTMQEIKSKNLPEDEKLWKLGNLFFETSRVSWTHGQVSLNTDYSFSILEELIEKYPSGNWADNAEMKMLLFNEGLIHEGGDITLSCIDKYKSFIEKYPNSELLPVAKLEIGNHYFDFVWGSIYEHYKRMELSEIKDYVNKAEFWYKDIISNYPDNEYSEKAKSRMKEIEAFLEESSWCLELIISDTSFLITDTITINLKLQNLGKKDKTIKVRKDLPNFAISVYNLGSNKNARSGGKVPFIKDFSIDMKEKQIISKVITANGGSYSEIQNIQELTFDDDGPFNAWGIGKYKLNHPGWYKIIARFKNPENYNDIISNEVFFLIKATNQTSPELNLKK